MCNRRFGYEYRVYCEHLFVSFSTYIQVLDKIPFPAFRRRIFGIFSIHLSLLTRAQKQTH